MVSEQGGLWWFLNKAVSGWLLNVTVSNLGNDVDIRERGILWQVPTVQSWLAGGNTVTNTDATVSQHILDSDHSRLKARVAEYFKKPADHLQSFSKFHPSRYACVYVLCLCIMHAFVRVCMFRLCMDMLAGRAHKHCKRSNSHVDLGLHVDLCSFPLY